MKVFYDPATGRLRGYRKTDSEELRFPKPSGVSEIEIDEEENQSVVDGLDNDYNSHDVNGGVLRRNGVAVSIQSESVNRLTRREVKTQLPARLDEIQAIIDGVDASNNTQLRAAVKVLARQVKRLTILVARSI